MSARDCQVALDLLSGLDFGFLLENCLPYIPSFNKVTGHLYCKNSKNLRPLDILACNSAQWFVSVSPLLPLGDCHTYTGQNVQKLQIFAIFTSYLGSILKSMKNDIEN